jgi:universal stress protein A
MARRITRIVVPTDFSGPSDAALEYARTLAERFGASLHLLHVLEDPDTGGVSESFIVTSPTWRTTLLDDARSRLSHRIKARESALVHTTGEVIVGNAAETIVDYAATRNADLIVMGTHGRTGLAHVLFGSVAETVVRTATCPVLTVREQARVESVPLTARGVEPINAC